MLRLGPAVVASLLFCTGCHSALVQASLHNATGSEMRLIEIDYPSASFGLQRLANGSDFKYRFKILGSGAVKLIYTDSAGHEHTAEGPVLHEGQEGQLQILADAKGVSWSPQLH